jgi:hypothetical protein
MDNAFSKTPCQQLQYHLLHQKSFQFFIQLAIFSYIACHAMSQGHLRHKLLLLCKEQIQAHIQHSGHVATHCNKHFGWTHLHFFEFGPLAYPIHTKLYPGQEKLLLSTSWYSAISCTDGRATFPSSSSFNTLNSNLTEYLKN